MTSVEYQQLVDFLTRQFSEVDRQLSGVDQQLIGLRQEVLGHFDEIYRRFERLERECQAITQALRRIEAQLADERGRREIIERDLAELKHHVAALQTRIDELEDRLRGVVGLPKD